MNDTFRDHVTSTGFTLTLTKTQIHVLVFLHRQLPGGHAPPYSASDTFVPAARALMRRGMLQHFNPPPQFTGTAAEWSAMRPAQRNEALGFTANQVIPVHFYYPLTNVGHITCHLLMEAGIYQEYADRIDERLAALCTVGPGRRPSRSSR